MDYGVNGPDILTQAKTKTATGGVLTPEESTALLNSGVTSSELNMMRQASRKPTPTAPASKFAPPKVDPFKDILKPSPKIATSPAELPAAQQGYSRVPHASTQAEADFLKRQQEQGLMGDQMYKPMSTRLMDEADKADAQVDAMSTATPAPEPIVVAPETVAPEPVAPPAKIAPATAPTVEKGPVSTAVEEKTGLDLSKPVAPEQAKQAVDSFAQFLSENPDGLTLANILDAVGVSLSAYGGVQRETQLQQRKKAQMQLALRRSEMAQEQVNQLQLKGADLANQLELIDRELASNLAIKGTERETMLLGKKLDLQNELALITPRMNAMIEQIRKTQGPTILAQKGGIAAMANSYLDSGGN